MIHRFSATIGGRKVEVSVEPIEGSRYRVTVEGRTRVVDARRVEAGSWSILPEGGGTARSIDVDGRSPDYVITAGGETLPIQMVEGRRADLESIVVGAPRTGPQAIRAPIPGKLVKLLVRQGDQVKAGQGIAVVEAMKMENELRAPRDGTVASLSVREGDTVEANQILATLG